MRNTLMLILPILVPSWRFFKAIEPSPRVQWAFVGQNGHPINEWQEFRPRPMTVTLWQMIGRLFWNPARNDALYVVSLAERIVQSPTSHSINEINRRILADLPRPPHDVGQLMRFRLVFVSRNVTGHHEEVLFTSDPVGTHRDVHS